MLCHGTSEGAAMAAMRDGLRPRAETGHQGNWKHTQCPSNHNAVYLTDAYPLFFGWNAVQDGSKERVAIIELDIEEIDTSMLIPDEDFLEQASRGEEIPEDDLFEELRTAGNSMGARTAFYRKYAWMWQEHWFRSMQAIGTCAHMDAIDARAIKRVALVDIAKRPDLGMVAGDPQVSMVNYQFCGPRYRALTRWLLTGGISDDLFMFVMPDMRDKAREQYENRNGIEVIGGCIEAIGK